MLETVKRLLKLLKAVVRILPVVLEVMQDFADDGKRNHSTSGASRQSSAAKAKS